MTKQELIEKLRAAVDGAIVLAEQWYNGAAPVSNRENNDNYCNLMDAKQHIVALESMLTVKGEPGEAIKILSNYFTPVGNKNRYSVRQYRECITILESTIADLTEQVRVRDAAIKELRGEVRSCNGAIRNCVAREGGLL
jgi:ssDNA-binding replication factor A large subunit